MAARLIRSPLALIAFAHDLAMAALAFALGLFLRVGDDFFLDYAGRLFPVGMPVFLGVCAVAFAFMDLYRGLWRYASLDDMVAILKAGTLALLLFLPVQFFLTRLVDLPRAQLVITWFVLIGLLAGPRIVYRVWRDRRFDNVLKRQGVTRIPVLLYGAGDGAELFLLALDRQVNAPYEAVGIVTDRAARVGRRIRGVDVYDRADKLADVVARLAARGRRPRRLIVTRDDADPARLNELLVQAEALGMTMARLPRPTDLREGVEDGTAIKPIALEDLLGRPQAVLDRPAMRDLVAGKRVLVTGAGGSIGSELVRQVSDFAPARLALLDSSEFALYEIDLELSRRHPALARAPLLADVRDGGRVEAIFGAEKPEIVFHAAALKHVPMVEYHPAEGVLTNAIGTRHVADACQRHGARTMVLISTDKAVNPTNVMGATKRLAEQYCQALDLAEARREGGTNYVSVRFGNVLGSTGSVVPLFQRQIALGGPLTVTHPDVTRYFMTVREAVELVLMASARDTASGAQSGKVYVLDMGKPVKIVDLARQMIRLAGKVPDKDIAIAFTGLRPGEKLYEEVLHESEDLVRAESGLLLANPRTADHKLLERSFAEIERLARAGQIDEMKALLGRLVPEYAPGKAGAAAAGGAQT
jgi:O-antigen biosynthesis protein WbqV